MLLGIRLRMTEHAPVQRQVVSMMSGLSAAMMNTLPIPFHNEHPC